MSKVSEQRVQSLPLPDDLAIDEVTDCEVVAPRRPNAETLFRSVKKTYGSVERRVNGRRVALLTVDGAKVLVVEVEDGCFEVRRSPATTRERALEALACIEKTLTPSIRLMN